MTVVPFALKFEIPVFEIPTKFLDKNVLGSPGNVSRHSSGNPEQESILM